MTRTRTFRCWVPHCVNSRKRTRLPNSLYHAFPVRNPERCRSWLQAVGYEDLIYLPMHSLRLRYVCSEHFTESDYVKKGSINNLLRAAVPTVFPPGTTPLTNNVMEEWPPKMASESPQQEGIAALVHSKYPKQSITTHEIYAAAASAVMLEHTPEDEPRPIEQLSSTLLEVIKPKVKVKSAVPSFPRISESLGISSPKVNVESVARSSPKVHVENVAVLPVVEHKPNFLSQTRVMDISQQVTFSSNMRNLTTCNMVVQSECEAVCEVEKKILDSSGGTRLPALPTELLLDYIQRNSGDGLLDGDMLLGFVVQRGSSVAIVPVRPDNLLDSTNSAESRKSEISQSADIESFIPIKTFVSSCHCENN